MSRLVVISNRVPMPEKNGTAPAGGLAVALQAALEERGGVWMGWSGKSSGTRDPAPLALTERGKSLFGEVAQARFSSLALSMKATTKVVDA